MILCKSPGKITPKKGSNLKRKEPPKIITLEMEDTYLQRGQ
jgi:hypothetical protein